MGVRKRQLHLKLPDELDAELRREAERCDKPAAEIVRRAIREFLQTRRRQALHDEISDYAREVAGTTLDLDNELEASGIDALAWLD